MPSRKSASNESHSDSRRTSLRRLSSVASLQAFFSRRRSNNASDAPNNSSSSNLSLTSSTVVNPPEPTLPAGLSRNDSQHVDNAVSKPRSPPPPPLVVQNQPASRRSSYICLPDDPIGGMPRSRTLSNLPLPIKTSKEPPVGQTRSHSRLPSTFFPSTRLPSPPASTRKHSHTQLASVGGKAAPAVRNRMKRSDTEPLLPVNFDQGGPLPRSTAFKENISPSPAKPLPPLSASDVDGKHSSPLVQDAQPPRRVWPHHRSTSLAPSLSNKSSPPPFAQHPAVRITAREHKSSPAYRSSKDRPPTPGGSKSMDVQRWSSQPVLKNTTNTANHHIISQHREIKHTRLLSAKQASTPPPPKTPATSQAQISTTKRRATNSTTHLREKSEQTPTHTQSRSSPFSHSRNKKLQTSSPPFNTLQYITASESPEYWLGRLSSLADRYRNEELATHLHKHHTTPKSETDKMHTPEAGIARLRRAFETLHDLCATPEAKDSLAVFQFQFASLTACAELSRPIVLNAVGCRDSGGGDEDGESAMGGVGEGRKMSFMHRLLGGRQKRMSLILS